MLAEFMSAELSKSKVPAADRIAHLLRHFGIGAILNACS